MGVVFGLSIFWTIIFNIWKFQQQARRSFIKCRKFLIKAHQTCADCIAVASPYSRLQEGFFHTKSYPCKFEERACTGNSDKLLLVRMHSKGLKEHNFNAIIGHFQLAFCHCIKMSLNAKPIIWKWVPSTGSFSRKSSSFTYERFCTRTRFETEAQATRKWPVTNWAQCMHNVMGVKSRKRQQGNYKPQRRMV